MVISGEREEAEKDWGEIGSRVGEGRGIKTRKGREFLK